MLCLCIFALKPCRMASQGWVKPDQGKSRYVYVPRMQFCFFERIFATKERKEHRDKSLHFFLLCILRIFAAIHPRPNHAQSCCFSCKTRPSSPVPSNPEKPGRFKRLYSVL